MELPNHIVIRQKQQIVERNAKKFSMEMLETLKWVKGWMEDHSTQNDTIRKVSDMIDKAEGGK
tara:strand:- start:374 stop:562 length:189 start_codon:yes stop_codon:yes gene_type:complete